MCKFQKCSHLCGYYNCAQLSYRCAGSIHKLCEPNGEREVQAYNRAPSRVQRQVRESGGEAPGQGFKGVKTP